MPTVVGRLNLSVPFVVVLLRAMLRGNSAMLSFCARLAVLLPVAPLALVFRATILAALANNALTGMA